MNVAAPRLSSQFASQAERQTRVDLAALYRCFAHFGWTDLIYTHLTARVPGEDGTYLINPYGLRFEEITASNLIKVDFDGNVLTGEHPYNEAGHLIHTAVLKARPEINFVVHSHTRAGMAVAAMKAGLLPLSQHAMVVVDQIAYHPYQDVTGADDECDLLAGDLGDKYLMILQNHGLLACGRSAAEAFYYHYYLEMACKVQVDVMSSGAEMIVPPPKAVRPVAAWGDPGDRVRGEREWSSLLRLLDGKDPSFRT
ncbi:MAG: class II aldolase/adducin family protein [Alphaproteobacteria bacterium]|nr:class II aldolase/adducin family protein [Alphaproteobacteria bacterium]